MTSSFTAAVIQDTCVELDAASAIQRTCALIAQAAEQGAQLVVFPEAFLGGYPKGIDFGVQIGSRTAEGRKRFAEYAARAISIPGPAVDQLATAARRHQLDLVIGVVERAGATLYCTALGIDRYGVLRGRHRKVMPTAAERYLWGSGDGSTLDVWASDFGQVGAVICWENYMPLLRATMYAQGIEFYCAPTVDDRDTWLPTMRHIALEGRCFVLSACPFQPDAIHPSRTIRGGSCIIGPLGEILAGPVFGQPTILTATLDRDRLQGDKFDFDPIGHYARPDIFHLDVNTRRLVSVTFPPPGEHET